MKLPLLYDTEAPARVVMHAGVLCDGCEGPIVGARYMCAQCPNVDLCERCEHDGSRHARTHALVKARWALPPRRNRPAALLPPLSPATITHRARITDANFKKETRAPSSARAPVPVRWLTATDLDALLLVEAACFDSPYPREYFERALKRNAPLRIAVSTSTPIMGYCAWTVQKQSDSGQVELRVTSLAVAPAARGTGLAQSLLNAALHAAKQHSGVVTVASLHVSVFNVPALRLYRAAGFRAVRWLRNYYGVNDDALLMHASVAFV